MTRDKLEFQSGVGKSLHDLSVCMNSRNEWLLSFCLVLTLPLPAGMGITFRKIALRLKHRKVIEQVGDVYIIKTLSSFRNLTTSFRLGQEFEEFTKGLDNRQCKVRCMSFLLCLFCSLFLHACLALCWFFLYCILNNENKTHNTVSLFVWLKDLNLIPAKRIMIVSVFSSRWWHGKGRHWCAIRRERRKTVAGPTGLRMKNYIW